MARRKKSALAKLHKTTKLVAVICALIGILAGALVCFMMSKNDRFLLKGQTQISYEAGQSHTYVEEGMEAYCFGMDVSDKKQVVLSEGITTDANGNYVIPAEEGTYTITYTVDCFKFGEKAPNGVIKRIRVFTVDAAEDDSRGDGEVAG